ncbi:MAG TPA: PAS domain S-box protein [Geminicoccaceae bacterium]|nr:PAS domain S-box protein [Geminicoccaceae bacterium]
MGAPAAELAASEARHRVLVEALAAIVWTTPADGLVDDMPGWRVLTGQTAAEVRGWGWLEALHPDDRARTRAAWAAAVARRTAYDAEYRLRGRDGGYRWYNGRGVPVLDEGGRVREWAGVCIDIDVRKRAEAEREEVTTQLKLAMQAAGMGTFELDPSSRRVRASESMDAMYGLPRDGGERTVADYLARVHPLDRDWVESETLAVAAGQAELAVEYRLQCPEGGVRWLAARGAAVGRADGGVRVVGAVFDITDRKRVEAALAEKEAQLRLALEAAALAEWDLDHRTWRFAPSPRLNALLDFPPGQGLTAADMRARYHPDDLPKLRAYQEEGVRRRDLRAVEREFRILLPDGRVRWLLGRGELLRDARGDIVRSIGVLIDVTERKATEERLRESEQRYRVLVETSPDAVCVHQDEIIILANRQAAALLGAAEPGVLVGRPAFDIVAPESLPLAQTRTRRLTVPGMRNEPTELTYRRLDGSRLFVEAASAAVLVDGRLAVQIAFRDITERKASEERQTLLLAELSHRVKNTLAVVRSIAQQSLAGDRPLDEAREVFIRRLGALAAAHTLLTASAWRGADLRQVVAGELAPHGKRARIAGEDLVLGPKGVLTLQLVLHELATNAAKYGALSVAEGEVEVAWEIARRPGGGAGPGAGDRMLRLTWREQDGPPVRPPVRQGFGRLLIEQMAAYDLGGRARLDFCPGGIAYELEVPLAGLTALG